ncbi:shikimate kinase [Egicoccus sp. AB-alg6-2]|uniref:shikimate kinase n=1 Tax=Egicoccus sp. AB-alg6-2 TaxID=3242692 RepID=UPI00359CE92A
MNGHPPRTPTHVVLVGMMGAGKTTTGAALASRLGRPLLDGDVELERRTGRTGAQIAATDGVDRLHHLEEEVLLDALSATTPTVIAAAGSVAEAERCQAPLAERALVVWLDAPVTALVSRMGSGDHRRPLEADAAHVLLQRRRAAFAAIADLHLDAVTPTDELVEAIVTALTDAVPDRDSAAGTADVERPETDQGDLP